MVKVNDMRKLIFYNMVTLDGFFEGPNNEIDWHKVDDEFNGFALNFLNNIDSLIFGRVTYELMAGYWPTKEATSDDPLIAERMNSLPKVVFSRSLDRVDWENSQLVRGDVVDEVYRLKQQPGKDLAIFGSAELAVELIENEIIDEFRIFVNPIALGSGNPLFKRLRKPLKLKLLESKVFKNGVVLLTYQPDQEEKDHA